LGHGKHAPVKRLSAGDGLVYYAPRQKMGAGDIVQAFVTIGRIRSGEAYQVRQSDSFSAWRRDVDYLEANEAPIRPLLDQLSFVRGNSNWGMVFRRGAFEISRADFLAIAAAMHADWQEAGGNRPGTS
jgi:hypothetical protein